MKQDEKTGRIQPTHGLFGSFTYKSWDSMRSRCYNPNNNSFHRYGGRGIVVCDRWLNDVAAFAADMGLRPSKDYSIERKDLDGNYEPGNCVWATSRDQYRNRSDNVMITFEGKTLCLLDWCREKNLKISTISARIIKGWKPEDALTYPVGSGIRPHYLARKKALRSYSAHCAE